MKYNYLSMIPALLFENPSSTEVPYSLKSDFVSVQKMSEVPQSKSSGSSFVSEWLHSSSQCRDASPPPSILPFPTKSHPRKDLHPLSKSSRFHQISWIQKKLKEVYGANSDLFEPLQLDQISVQFDSSMRNTAKIDLDNLSISFHPKAFEKVESDQEIVAILCHEVGHFLLGHRPFQEEFPPDLVQQDPGFQQTKRSFNSFERQFEKKLLSESFVRAKMEKFRDELLQSPQFKDTKEFAEIVKIETSPSFTKSSKYQFVLDQVESFARSHPSLTSRRFLKNLQREKEYEKCSQKREQMHSALYHEKVDSLLGEEGAWKNWQEEQADEIGFRMFLRWGGKPESFFRALVHTLREKEPDLESYALEIIAAKDPWSLESPERGSGSHPSGKWRLYNIWVREMQLRYPEEYKQLLKSSPRRELHEPPKRSGFIG